jgi:hypothetical protein
LTYTFATAGTTAPQQQSVSLQGTGAAFSYTTSITNNTIPVGALTIASGASGSVASGGTAALIIQVNPTGVTSGAYSGSVTVTAGTQTLLITVNVNVGAAFSGVFTPTVGAVVNSPAAGISFSIPAGTASTSFGNLVITPVGSGAIQISPPVITFTSGTGWLTQVAAAGCTATTLVSCSDALSISAASLTAGNSYVANIAVSSTTAGIATLNIPVTVTVTNGPVFLQGASATPTRLVFTGAPSPTPILNCNGGVCAVSLTTNFTSVSSVTITPSPAASWLAICNNTTVPGCVPGTAALTGQTISGTATSLTVAVSSFNLAPKTYTGTITVSATSGVNGPLVIPVSMVVLPQNPSGVGIYRSSGLWLLDSNFNQTFDGGDQVSAFGGLPGDIPVYGDWNGDGRTKIGIYRNGTWLLDYNGNGVYEPTADRVYVFGGQPGDYPVVGDWNGTGYSKIGIFRQGFFWILDVNGNGIIDAGDATFAFGGATGCTAALPGAYSVISTAVAGACDMPVVGDWNGNGNAKVGVVRQGFLWILDQTGAQAFVATGANASNVFAFGGISGDVPLVGDWNNSGQANVGVFRGGFLFVEGANRTGIGATGVGSAFAFGGIAGDIPVVGRWR